MPAASGAGKKYWLEDHDTAERILDPPVQFMEYEVLREINVRLLFFGFIQTNDEQAAKDIQIRWTIDGTPYLVTQTALHNTFYWVYRNVTPSSVGTLGLTSTTTEVNAGLHVDKRGLHFVIEMSMQSLPGTTQVLTGWAAYETLEEAL
jgi:hypothetical protein